MNKYSYQSDAVGNLYRAALYLARGSGDIGLQFLVKAKGKLGARLDSRLDLLIDKREEYLNTRQNCLYWAEKILDQYHRLKHSLL